MGNHLNLRSVFTFSCTVLLLATADLYAGTETPPAKPDKMITIWPLLDYRENSANKSSKLSILGPILSFDRTSEDKSIAFRPLFHSAADIRGTRNFSYYLYPLASSETTPDVSRFEALQILQKNTFRKAEPDEKESQFMLFPFIISGESKKYGSYLALFPLYGDIYERFWRDEYHFALFPVYGRTVNKGTTNYNILWPFLSFTRGDREAGFRIWPLYGQAAKEGNYSSRFILWPLYSQEEHGIDTSNPSSRLSIFPLYASFDSPYITSRTWLWPFFGYSFDNRNQQEERDYLWPFWLTVSGSERTVISFLPFYSRERTNDSTKNWYLWPLYRNDTMHSPSYRQERDKVLFFIFTDRIERWAQDGKERRRTALWPLFLYRSSPEGEKNLTMPALIESILDKEGIENLWAPLWRVYSHQWNDRGDSSLSLFWNLYWHDRRENSLGWELFPFVRNRSSSSFFEVQILKGLINYCESGNRRGLSLFWLPFDYDWQSDAPPKESTH
jgi:hypothetical protein